MRKKLNACNGLELSSEEISLGDESVQEDRDDDIETQKPPHPAGSFYLKFIMQFLFARFNALLKEAVIS